MTQKKSDGRRTVNVRQDTYDKIRSFAKEETNGNGTEMIERFVEEAIKHRQYSGEYVSPKRAELSFHQWGVEKVAHHILEAALFLAKNSQEYQAAGDDTGRLAIAYILALMGQQKISGDDLIILANRLSLDGSKLQQTLENKKNDRKYQE